MTDVDAAYTATAPLLGDFAGTIDVDASPRLPGRLLADERWLADRVADTARRWGCDDDRVNGTLWWYSASSTFAVAPVAMLLATGRAPDPTPDRMQVVLRDNGYLAATRSDGLVGSVGEYRDAAIESFGRVIAALAAVSGASPRALWAIAGDSFAGRGLDVGRRFGDVDAAAAMVAAVAVDPFVAPRYVEVAARRFVRRNSCCLIYRVPGGGKCVSCPRQPPADREAALRRRV